MKIRYETGYDCPVRKLLTILRDKEVSMGVEGSFIRIEGMYLCLDIICMCNLLQNVLQSATFLNKKDGCHTFEVHTVDKHAI